MTIDLWPIVGRGQLVQAFRPGEAEANEGPFRTLRTHGWATSGVSVVTRNDNHASGRLTLFSVLNVAAARRARDGDRRSAKALARAAARVEKTKSFALLKRLLSGKPMEQVTAAIQGSDTMWPELLDVLRLVARDTRKASREQPSSAGHTETVTGRILEQLPNGVVLQAETGTKTLVPRWLAQSAHRANVGDLLALVTDQLDDTQMVVKAAPAIDLRADAQTPFGRSPPVLHLNAKDGRLLSRTPAPLKILVPVAIEG